MQGKAWGKEAALCTHGADTRCPGATDGEMLFANIDDGYLEGILRGYRGGILTSSDYANLCQCETIEGARPRAASSTPPDGRA